MFFVALKLALISLIYSAILFFKDREDIFEVLDNPEFGLPGMDQETFNKWWIFVNGAIDLLFGTLTVMSLALVIVWFHNYMKVMLCV